MPGFTSKNQFYRSVALIVCCIYVFSSAAFAQNTGRRMISLNDQWQFSKDKSAWEHVNLPHTWNAKDVMDDEPGYYRGIGWYKRKLAVADSLKGKKIFISFNGADQETEIYINGKLAGSHIGGYTKLLFRSISTSTIKTMKLK